MAIESVAIHGRLIYLDPGGKRVRAIVQDPQGSTAELGKRVSLIAEGNTAQLLERLKGYKTTLASCASVTRKTSGIKAASRTQRKIPC